jgi:dihydroneopterin aldolase
MDIVILRNLKFDLAIGRDAWRRPGKPQPVSITVNLLPKQTFEAAALEDDVNLTLDYGLLYKRIQANIKDKRYGNIQGFMLDLAQVIDGYKLLNVDIVLPKALLDATGGLHYHLRVEKSAPDQVDATWSVAIKSIVCSCIVGVNPHERLFKQRLSFDIVLSGPQPLDPSVDGQAVADEGLHDMVKDIVEVSALITIPCQRLTV